MSNNESISKDNICKIKCITKRLKATCKFCGVSDYIDLNLRMESTCDMSPAIMFTCKCSTCGRTTIHTSIKNEYEEQIIKALESKGYHHITFDFITRSYRGPFYPDNVKLTKDSLPRGWEYRYDPELNEAVLIIVEDLRATPTLYNDCIRWIYNDFPQNPIIDAEFE